MDEAELKCRKLHMGAIPFSPTYKNCVLKVIYWRMRKLHHLGLHRNVRQLIKLQNKTGIKYDSTLNLSDIEKISDWYLKRGRR